MTSVPSWIRWPGLGVHVATGAGSYKVLLEEIRGRDPSIIVTIGSSRVSTIPGVSIAGATPELTLLTPGLDAEYLIAGLVISERIIPVTPTGIPTPAVVTRAVLKKARIPALVVDAGSHLTPRVPHVSLPSRTVGGMIHECKGLPLDRAKSLYEEAYMLGRSIASPGTIHFLGESIPGGTTLALGILEGLGYEARGKVSSAGPDNPHDLKWSLVSKGLEACRKEYGGCEDPFRVVACLGDPVHVSVAGLAAGILDESEPVFLAGGTQMAAVLALIKAFRGLDDAVGRIAIATTRWLVEDPTSDLVGLVKKIEPRVPVVYYDYNFRGLGYEGLEAYEKGFVKEGVAIGGAGVAASLLRGLDDEEIHKAIVRDYQLLLEELKSDSRR